MNIFQQDFDFFQSTLKQLHPNIYDGCPDFDKEAGKLMAELASETDILHFEAKLKQFSHKLYDGHTGVISYSSVNKLAFPLLVWWHETGWYVNAIAAKNQDVLGSRITAINGKNTEKVMSAIMTLASGENEYWYREQAAWILRQPGNLQLLGMAAPDNNLHLKLEKDGVISELVISATEDNRLTQIPFKGVTQFRDIPYWGKAIPESDVYYMQFNSFSDDQNDKPDNEFPIWKAFLRNCFATIDSLKINNLVVDLRNNGGGNSYMGNIFFSYCSLPDSLYNYSIEMCFSELLLKQYQMDIPTLQEQLTKDLGHDVVITQLPYVLKVYNETPTKVPVSMITDSKLNEDAWVKQHLFKGKLILLTDSRTFSSALIFATICRDNGLATIYGTPTGGKPTCYGDILDFVLPNTGIKCKVSHKCFKRPNFNLDPADSLYPDVLFSIHPNDYFNGKDTLWDKVLNDIKQNSVPLPSQK